MPWADNLPNCNIRTPFQNLVMDFKQLHALACKNKNITSFRHVADLCSEIFNTIDHFAPPGEAEFASLLTNLQMQLDEIIRKKSGKDQAVEFALQTGIINKRFAVLKIAVTEAMRAYKINKEQNTPADTSATKMRPGLVPPFSNDYLQSVIDSFNDIPEHKNCLAAMKRPFAKQPVASALACMSFSAGIGAISQLITNSSHDDSPITSINDSRIVVPAITFAVSSASFAYAFFKSRPPKDLAPRATENDLINEADGKKPLMSGYGSVQSDV